MKLRLSISSLIVALISSVAFASHPPVQTTKNPIGSTVYLKNNSLLPKRITLVTYGPFLKSERIERVIVMPGQKISRTYTFKTKLFLADKQEVKALKNGERINKGEPFLVIRRDTRDQIYKLFE